MTLPLSTAQRATLSLLTSGPRSTADLGASIGVGHGMELMLRVLKQRGMIRHVVGRESRPGKGSWELTGYGRSVVGGKR